MMKHCHDCTYQSYPSAVYSVIKYNAADEAYRDRMFVAVRPAFLTITCLCRKADLDGKIFGEIHSSVRRPKWEKWRGTSYMHLLSAGATSSSESDDEMPDTAAPSMRLFVLDDPSIDTVCWECF